MTLLPGAPSLLITCSTDKVLKLWDITGGKPKMVAQNQPAIGRGWHSSTHRLNLSRFRL